MSLLRDQTNASAPVRPIIAAVQAIALLTFVVLFNLGLYVLIIFIVDHWHISDSVYPALVLFLSFALSIGIILIVVLREKVDTRNAQNPLLKKFGFTPIMIIVAAVFSVFATLTPAAKKIVPDPNYTPKLVLANVGLTCSTKSNDPPQASDLVVMIYSEDDTYIKDVSDFLKNPALMEKAKEKNVNYIKPDLNDPFFKLLHDYSRLRSTQSAGLAHDMRDQSNWLAYRIALKDAGTRTFIPIPAKYDRSHTTRLFVVAEQFPDSPQPDVTALASSTQPLSAVRKNILPLFQVQIHPKKPASEPHLTDLNLEAITDHFCWHGAVL